MDYTDGDLVSVDLKEIWSPYSNLRFIERDGKKILQQIWASQTRHEWRDVPLEVEGK